MEMWTLGVDGEGNQVWEKEPFEINWPKDDLRAVEEVVDRVDTYVQGFNKPDGMFNFVFSKEETESLMRAAVMCGYERRPTQLGRFIEKKLGEVLPPHLLRLPCANVLPLNPSRQFDMGPESPFALMFNW